MSKSSTSFVVVLCLFVVILHLFLVVFYILFYVSFFILLVIWLTFQQEMLTVTSYRGSVLVGLFRNPSIWLW